MWLLLLACPPAHEDSTPDTEAVVETAPDTELPPVDSEELPDAPELWAFSHEHGLVEEPFTLTVEALVEGLELLYSTDGREPTTPWPGSLELSGTTVLRMAATHEGEPVAHRAMTWVFPSQVPAQAAPEDYPGQWWEGQEGGPYPADYGMDSKVVDAWSNSFPAVFDRLPTLSLVIPPESLFAPDTGIHENAKEQGIDWERAVWAELFGAGEQGFEVACGIRIQGGAGRRADRTPKKSFRLLFKKDYGPGKLDYPLFEGDELGAYDTLVLRGRYNRSWGHYQHAQRARSLYMRERFALDLFRDMGHLASNSRQVHLYLNGLYWGIYLLQERPDANYLAARLGGADTDYDVLNSTIPTDGDKLGWEDLMALVRSGLEGDEAWQSFTDLVDEENLVDYLLVQLYLGNIDWPRKNWYAAHRRDNSVGWRFFMWDSELTMVNTTDDLIDGADDADGPGEIFQAARANSQFRALFSERAHLHLDEGGQLHKTAMTERWDAMAAEVKTVVIAESARWGDHWLVERQDPEAERYTLAHWNTENERVSGYYLSNRHARFLEHLEAAGLWNEGQ